MPGPAVGYAHIQRGVLGAGAIIDGPALIEEPFTVVVLAPGDTARLDQHGNFDIAIAR